MNHITIPTADTAAFGMPALGGVESGCVTEVRIADVRTRIYGITVSAADKGAPTGVSAWSPPV